MSKFKVGDNVKCVEPYLADTTYGNVYTVIDVSECNLYFTYIDDVGDRPERLQGRFELVEPNSILTPEEVFEHLRKGTKLQVRHTGKVGHKDWCDVLKPELTTYEVMIVAEWRIKPEPEIIELNGKKYREIIE